MTTTARRRRPEATTHVTSHVPGHVDTLEQLEDAVDVLDGLHGGEPHHERHARSHPLRRVWLFLISMRTGLWIILVLGILTLLGTLLMQVDPEVRADPQAYQQWLAGTPTQRYGGWTGILDTLGLFHVFSTWHFQGLFALLSLSILACSINRAPRLWRLATRPRTSMREAFFTHAPLRATIDLPSDVETSDQKVRDALRGKHFRVLDGHANTGSDIYGDRFRWGPFGTVVAHLSLIVIMLGFVVSATTGFKDKDVIAPVGVPVNVGHGTGLVVKALSFTDTYYANGAPKDYVSDLVLTKDGTQVGRQEVRVNSPLIYGGVWFHQSSFGVGADVTVSEKGEQVFSGTVPLRWQSDDGQQSIGQFTIPSKGITVYVIEAASGQVLADLPAGSAQLEVHKTGLQNPVGAPVLNQGTSAPLDGLTYTYVRNRQYAGLTIKQDNGSALVWIGSALLILGCYLVFFMPHRRIWAQVRRNPDGTSQVRIGAPFKRDPAFEPLFRDIVSAIKTTGATTGKTTGKTTDA
jgi:cytochrome c biogenesis protein